MINISTGGQKFNSGYDISLEYIKSGIKHIELSGGKYDNDQLSKLVKLKNEASFQIHNYFPPPEKPFVLNLASLNSDIAKLSIEHIKKGINWAYELESFVYSFHAGFLLDPKINELGRKVSSQKLFNREESTLRFIERLNEIDNYAKTKGVKLLIENNVLSKKNFDQFGCDPFIMANEVDFLKIMKNTSKNVELLIDLAHLKVSANSLGFDPIKFLINTDKWIKAYHLSDNDGTRDSNEPISKNSWFWPYLKKNVSYHTLEVHNKSSQELYEQLNLAKFFIEA